MKTAFDPGASGRFQRLSRMDIRLGHGRDAGYPAPPAQIRAGATNAHGSYLGCKPKRLGVGAQSALRGTGAGPRLQEADFQAFPRTCSTPSGSVDSAGEAATTTCVALHD